MCATAGSWDKNNDVSQLRYANMPSRYACSRAAHYGILSLISGDSDAKRSVGRKRTHSNGIRKLAHLGVLNETVVHGTARRTVAANRGTFEKYYGRVEGMRIHARRNPGELRLNRSLRSVINRTRCSPFGFAECTKHEV